VRTELTERFGGVTAFLQAPAAGAWKEAGDEPIEREELVLFEVMADSLDRDFWRGYRAKLEERFRQKEILVRAMATDVL
jgi:hypothetical protein